MLRNPSWSFRNCDSDSSDPPREATLLPILTLPGIAVPATERVLYPNISFFSDGVHFFLEFCVNICMLAAI